MNQINATSDIATNDNRSAATPLHGTDDRLTVHGATEIRVAYIEACWHHDIVERARRSFAQKLATQGITENQIDLFQVPGSLEIPLQTKLLAESGNYDIVVACGLVVDGGIYRHDFVAATVIDAMMRVQLDTNVPVLSVVLTPKEFHESKEHHDFFYDHFVKKGEEAGNACLMTLANLQRLKKTLSA